MREEVIIATRLNKYQQIEFGLIDTKHPIFTTMTYKYLAKEKYCISLEFYEAQQKRLIYQELFLYNYKDTYDYTKYLTYIHIHHDMDVRNVIYKRRQIHADLSEIFTIILLYQDSNQTVVIEKYKVEHYPAFKMTLIQYNSLKNETTSS